MKNLLLLLILANILYLMWGMFATENPQPGVAVVEESELGPPLDVTTGQDSNSVASVGAVLGLSLIHISEPTRQLASSRMPSSA